MRFVIYAPDSICYKKTSDLYKFQYHTTFISLPEGLTMNRRKCVTEISMQYFMCKTIKRSKLQKNISSQYPQHKLEYCRDDSEIAVRIIRTHGREGSKNITSTIWTQEARKPISGPILSKRMYNNDLNISD